MYKKLSLLYTMILLFTCHVRAQDDGPSRDNTDRILSFHSNIDVHTDGTMLVTENITIFNGNGESGTGPDGRVRTSENNDIKRGIVREFPTVYKDSSGFFSNTGFDLKSVSKNGKQEPFTTEKISNGVRIIIGNKDVLLDNGVYHYRIEYETNRQLIFHGDKDELYWNVNGNGWVFTADTVACAITFPEGAVIKDFDCYTGATGAKDKNCDAHKSGTNKIFFSTSQRLQAYDGLTVAASIAKGVIAPPNTLNKFMTFLQSNYIIPLLAFATFFLLVFYCVVWYKKGRDPDKGVVYPQFSPPPGLTPADCGYIMEQGFSPHLFTAALIDCAVKKQLGIEISREGLIFKSNVYHFTRPADAHVVTPTSEIYGFDVNTLYGQSARKGTYNSVLKSCNDALARALNERFLIRRGKSNKVNGLFSLNKGYTQFGCAVIVVVIFLCLQFLFSHLSFRLAAMSAGFLAAIFIIHNIFVRIMSAYTKQGREVVDHLLGFKMYLETAEQHIYERLTPPEKTLELFEKYLPYAIALQVENEWAEKFEDIMQKALDHGYTPTYYGMQGGGFHSFSMNDMSRSLSSGLSGTVSSASTPPSSSSGGSGGGGSSGGGGGGGGGGGW